MKIFKRSYLFLALPTIFVSIAPLSAEHDNEGAYRESRTTQYNRPIQYQSPRSSQPQPLRNKQYNPYNPSRYTHYDPYRHPSQVNNNYYGDGYDNYYYQETLQGYNPFPEEETQPYNFYSQYDEDLETQPRE